MKTKPLFLILILGIAITGYLAYRTTTPEYAMGKVEKAILKNDKTICDKYLTPTGDKVVTELLKVQSDETRTAPIVLLSKRYEGNKLTVKFTQPAPKGPLTAEIIMFKDGFHWDFHDIHIYTIDGYEFDVLLSYALDNPVKTAARFAWKNPGAVFGAFLQGFAYGASGSF